MAGMFTSSDIIFGRAKKAYESARNSASHDREQITEALVTLVFSAASLEAFINDIIELASLYTHDTIGQQQEASTVKTLAILGEQIEAERGSITLKYMLARAIFTGETYDKSNQPFQDFALLLR